MDVCSCLLAVYSRSFPALVAVETLSSIALQETEMENLPKMIKVRVFASNRFRKYQTLTKPLSDFKLLLLYFFLFQERRVAAVQHLIIFG